MGVQPTVADVARVAGVSRQTVSNVLNTPSIVREGTRERVEQAIRELGYRPHASARRLRTRRSSTIGIRLDAMAAGISGSIHDRFLHALTAQAAERSMRVLLFTAQDPEDEIEQIRRLNDAADVDAFVLTSTFHGDPRTEWLIDNEVPFVTFGRPWGVDDINDPRHHWVDVDGRAGVRAATEHLLAQGRRRVAFLGWPAGSGTGDDRRRGWEDAMRPVVGEHALQELVVTSEDGAPLARHAVVDAFGPVLEVDAVVCASDSLALGALLGLASVGHREVPVIGFDDTPVADAVGFSSVEQQLGRVAAGVLELLLGETGDSVVRGSDSAHRLVTPRLVVRETRPLLHPDPGPASLPGRHQETGSRP